MSRNRLMDFESIDRFVRGGNAYFTVVNPDSGSRYTFRVSQRENENGEKSPFFVGVLRGPDNTSHYQYLGVIFDGKTYRHTAKSRISNGAPSAHCFEWFWKVLTARSQKALDRVEVWHEGRCAVCGRKLTVPASIESGIGPVCDGRI